MTFASIDLCQLCQQQLLTLYIVKAFICWRWILQNTKNIISLLIFRKIKRLVRMIWDLLSLSTNSHVVTLYGCDGGTDALIKCCHTVCQTDMTILQCNIFWLYWLTWYQSYILTLMWPLQALLPYRSAKRRTYSLYQFLESGGGIKPTYPIWRLVFYTLSTLFESIQDV